MEESNKSPASPPPAAENSDPAPTNAAVESANREKTLFMRFLRGKGLKLTRQREVVVDEIFNDTGHFEAEEIVQRLKNNRTRVSRATVYRTLELLRECHLVEKLDIGDFGSLYEHVHLGGHHDHLICNQCRNVIEFHNDRLEKIQDEICQNFDFEDTHHSLRIFGTCSKCRNSAS